MLSWPAAFGAAYRVQFKDSLNDPDWQDLSGNLTILGSNAYAVDPAPPAGQRFYRVVLSP
jgi:hypothetical protein